MTHFGMFAKGGIHFSNPKEVIWRYDLVWENLKGNTIVKYSLGLNSSIG